MPPGEALLEDWGGGSEYPTYSTVDYFTEMYRIPEITDFPTWYPVLANLNISYVLFSVAAPIWCSY